ncbi:hemolysin family protein [Nostocoides australiense]|nr:hemolysin family protein [Tetrasphaera australiensis]HRW01396.1 hemolysin family protein [Tetrasphaera sp.]
MPTRLILVAIAAILFAFVLALGEAAISRSSRVRAEELGDEGRAGARSLAKILGDSAAYLSVTAFLRAVAEAVAAVCITLSVSSLTDSFWRTLLISIGIMSLVSFVAVGVSPRTLGRQHSDRVALALAPLIAWLHRILGPVARLLVLIANMVTPGRGYRDGPFQSESELRDLVDIAGENSLIEDDEREMLHSVFELGDTVAREVMVPRTDMVSIEVGKHGRQAMSLFNRSGFSRLPVVGDGPDDVVGLVYLKDLVRHMTSGGVELSTLPIASIMRPMPFVPESKPVDDLLREMQLGSVHIAIVVDEYGGTAGLVTIEDIIEEIVGEIDDEYDRETPGVEDLGDGRFRIPATMNVDDFAEEFDIDLDEDDVDSVGGLIAKQLGQVPILGSTCEVGRFLLTAERMAGRRHRIASVLVTPLPPVVGADGELVEAQDAAGGRSREQRA